MVRIKTKRQRIATTACSICYFVGIIISLIGIGINNNLILILGSILWSAAGLLDQIDFFFLNETLFGWSPSMNPYDWVD